MLNDTFPLRVEAIPAAHASEWRADDSFPPSATQAWQLIFVRSGAIEERCDARHVLLRAGGLLFHQPGEVFAMTTVARSRPRRCASTLLHRRGHGPFPRRDAAHGACRAA